MLQHVDMLAFETIPCGMEVKALDHLLRTEGLAQHIPSWISFNCTDGTRFVYGDPLSDAIALMNNQPDHRVFACGVNCVSPLKAPLMVKSIREELSVGKRVICYPNSGEVFCERWIDKSGPTQQQLVDLLLDCLWQGASIVGGGECKVEKCDC
jgi:S-methylmethionine-dependent homocysteine/selenocysteine methylase